MRSETDANKNLKKKKKKKYARGYALLFNRRESKPKLRSRQLYAISQPKFKEHSKLYQAKLAHKAILAKFL